MEFLLDCCTVNDIKIIILMCMGLLPGPFLIKTSGIKSELNRILAFKNQYTFIPLFLQGVSSKVENKDLLCPYFPWVRVTDWSKVAQ